VVLRANKAGQPLYVVVLEQKAGKKRAEKVHCSARFLGCFIDDIWILRKNVKVEAKSRPIKWYLNLASFCKIMEIL
jgi:predicted transcriptional regulator